MLTAILIALAAVGIAAAVTQVAIPRLAAARIERRLTGSGGVAAVEIAAVPALRLLRNRGDRIVVRGRDLTIGLGGDSGAGPAGLAALDGFPEVDIELVDFRAGPFDVAAFVLARSGGGSYAMATEGSIAGAELVGIGDRWLRAAIPGGGVIGAVAGAAPLGSRSVPFALEVEILSEPAGLRVGSGGGSIAGYPAGPIATTIAAAVARRLEIVP